MSEFTEVMRQARRMCETFCDACSKCPIGNANELECGITPTSEMDFKEVERRVMQWAAEHPEPVYPSWEEGWRQIFPDAKYTPCPGNFGIKYIVPDCAYRACTDCKSNPMPAEVAEKLGIKPIAPEKPPKHDCDTCKFERRKGTDEPCVKCKHCIDCEESITTAPDLWEAADKNVT